MKYLYDKDTVEEANDSLAPLRSCARNQEDEIRAKKSSKYIPSKSKHTSKQKNKQTNKQTNKLTH